MEEAEKKEPDTNKGDILFYVVGEIWDIYGQSTRISMYSEADRENKVTRDVVARWREEMQDSIIVDEATTNRFKDCVVIVTFFHRLDDHSSQNE